MDNSEQLTGAELTKHTTNRKHNKAYLTTIQVQKQLSKTQLILQNKLFDI